MNAIQPYGPTAAREHGRPGRELRTATTTVDIHSHVAVPAAAALVRPHLDPKTIPLAHFASVDTRQVNERQEADRRSRITGLDDGLEQRLRDLDAMGIDMQVVMPPPPQLYFTVPADIAVQAMRIVNDGIAEYVARRPDRFVGLGGVPLQDVAAAANELERVMRHHQFKGAEILTNVAGRELSEPAFAPFWQKAEELRALIVIHPNGFTQADRLSRYYFNNIIGNPLDTALALHHLIFGGVLARHPDLKILAVHGAGYAGSYSGRMDHAWGARSDCRGDLPRPPTEYLKKIYVDTVVFTPHQLRALAELFGFDHILMGTDYPFDMGEYDPLGHVASVEAFDAKTRAAIAGGNARRLLGI